MRMSAPQCKAMVLIAPRSQYESQFLSSLRRFEEKGVQPMPGVQVRVCLFIPVAPFDSF